MTSLRVNLDDSGISPATTVLEATESFEVEIINDGPPKHVNLGIIGDAEPYVSAEVNNVYVEDDQTVEIVVGPTPGEIKGVLKLTSDYGSDSAEVDISVGDETQTEPDEGVAVDDSLSQPMKPSEETDELPRVDIAVVVVLGIAAFFSLAFSFVFEGFSVVGVVIAAFAILGAAFVWFVSRSSDVMGPKD